MTGTWRVMAQQCHPGTVHCRLVVASESAVRVSVHAPCQEARHTVHTSAVQHEPRPFRPSNTRWHSTRGCAQLRLHMKLALQVALPYLESKLDRLYKLHAGSGVLGLALRRSSGGGRERDVGGASTSSSTASGEVRRPRMRANPAPCSFTCVVVMACTHG